MQSAKARSENQGITLAAISYDSEEILRDFAVRRKIDLPLLADHHSKIIRAYHLLNPEAVGPYMGMARPGFYFIDVKGVIREKFFETKYRDRRSGNSVISKLFPELAEEVTSTVEAPHLQLAAEQSDRVVIPGSRITLTAEVRLPRDIHVYAPGTKGYKTVDLAIDCPAGLEVTPATYPDPKVLYMPAIQEHVPVFDGTFRIRQDLKVSSAYAFSESLGPDGKTFTITGSLAYQACDNKTCFLPASARIQWQVRVLPLDRQRSPKDIRHK